jgi:Tol biopolymer transport system component/DNA-binding winged helix-turn-helix (wHTH) protein
MLERSPLKGHEFPRLESKNAANTLTGNKILTFGPFRLDVAMRQLWKGSERLEMKPKVFDTLLYMVSNPGRLLTKEELMKNIWPDRFVSEANLMQNMSVLRRLLGESDTDTKYIGTFQGRGYQFLVQVEDEVPAREIAATQPAQTPAGRLFRILLLTALFVVLASMAFFGLRSRVPATATILPRTPLTRLPGSEYQPAISRDGTKVAFVWRTPGSSEAQLMAKGFEDDQPKLFSSVPGDYSSPAWSPDGRSLAYLRRSGGALQLIVRSERGSQERVLAKLFPTRYGLNCRHLDWSPDGTQIAVDDKAAPDDPFSIFLIEVAAGKRIHATRPEKTDIGDVSPRFSPDGKTLSFLRMSTWFHQDLYTIGLNGGQAIRRTSDGRQISDHDWSPDGTAVYVASNRGGEFRIWKVLLTRAGASGEPLATQVASLNTLQFSISRSDGKVVLSDLAQHLNIWRLDVTSASHGNPVWAPVVASTAVDFLPQLSPDGKRLCFLSDRSGSQQLWVSDVDGGNATQLTRQGLRPFTGGWSPDSARIIFHDVTNMAIYVIGANGGVPEKVGEPGTGGHPVFSADGLGFFFNRGTHLMFRTFKGSDMLLIKEPAYHKQPSADGRYLYFSGTLVNSTIARLEIATRKKETVVSDLLPGYWGAWVAGSAGVYYLAADPQSPTASVIRFHSFASNLDTDLTRFPEPLPPVGTTTWSLSPDERFLYGVRFDRSEADLVSVGKLQ